jgi:glutamate synthase domain-containing protein 3
MTGGRVVILGEIGKNFGAGMSGGIAYIYDKEKQLAQRINKEGVDLDRVESTEDERELKEMIEKYVIATGSKEAQDILSNWNRSKDDFIKVMPVDYKRVLKEQAKKMREV